MSKSKVIKIVDMQHFIKLFGKPKLNRIDNKTLFDLINPPTFHHVVRIKK